MLISETDMKRLEKMGYARREFARCDNHGYAQLRNVRGHCVFYDLKKQQCKAYEARPLGCRLYPVIYSEEEGVIVDDLCPRKSTVTYAEMTSKGRKVIRLLKTIDGQAKKHSPNSRSASRGFDMKASNNIK